MSLAWLYVHLTRTFSPEISSEIRVVISCLLYQIPSLLHEEWIKPITDRRIFYCPLVPANRLRAIFHGRPSIPLDCSALYIALSDIMTATVRNNFPFSSSNVQRLITGVFSLSPFLSWLLAEIYSMFSARNTRRRPKTKKEKSCNNSEETFSV